MQDKSSDEVEITAAQAPLKFFLKPAPIKVYKAINSLKLPILLPYGGLVTMVTFSSLVNGLNIFWTDECCTLTKSANPAFWAFSFAISTISSSISKPTIWTPFSTAAAIPFSLLCLASSSNSFQASCSNCFKLKKPKCVRRIPGAVSVATAAASKSKVPEPHIGSKKFSKL